MRIAIDCCPLGLDHPRLWLFWASVGSSWVQWQEWAGLKPCARVEMAVIVEVVATGVLSWRDPWRCRGPP